MIFKLGTLAQVADDHGNRLTTAGMALETLANLLGLDGSEHGLSDSQAYGLSCAISSIGALVRDAGFDLCSKAESEVRK
ncbi:hypothetical protein QN382_03525 [Pseudomonas sp. 10B1]|uniref:hypothetical protein n=1 Tax=unclassified Pseudomonas TaxID=196821 RepID=UPI002B22D476|nr:MULTISPECIES: hypothetical protein [unclassified Pseudomonas]MEA9997195.1 hypothetical protein [Pseudomonas sp. AA4]MEB0088404.1 hypothetical protein [Pseudomonas sp. RTI1]MEB0128190.1 hypothetical protein [Pseudomonas sp. CCC1.2]MEB0155487.1 hypothetical protein [Pseudomonas sp. CCC4.3]MEB0181120.1 hypothetical protein [Pseudomonas sp. CCC3.2]